MLQIHTVGMVISQQKHFREMEAYVQSFLIVLVGSTLFSRFVWEWFKDEPFHGCCSQLNEIDHVLLEHSFTATEAF